MSSATVDPRITRSETLRPGHACALCRLYRHRKTVSHTACMGGPEVEPIGKRIAEEVRTITYRAGPTDIGSGRKWAIERWGIVPESWMAGIAPTPASTSPSSRLRPFHFPR